MSGIAWYRVLLYLLPAQFRKRFGDDMVRLQQQRFLECGTLRHWMGTALLALGDLGSTFWREWSAQLFGRPDEALLRASRFGFGRGAAGVVAKRRGSWENSVVDRVSVVLRHTLRRLRRQWGTSLVIVATLGLGVGATVSIYSYVHAALVRPLPFDHAEKLVRVWPGMTFSKQLLDGFRTEVDSYDAIAAYTGWQMSMTGTERSEELQAVAVTPGFFTVFEVIPSLGRTLRDTDSLPGAEPVVVLSDGLWTSRFGSDPKIVGQLIDFGALDGEAKDRDRRRVVGVLPARHEPIVPTAKLWIPLPIDVTDEEDYGGSWYLNALGRLRTDANPETASAEISAVSQRLKGGDYPSISDEAMGSARVVSLRHWLVDDVQGPLLLLLGAVALVLLIACTNVASLLIARTASRDGELRLRAALGAKRGRLLLELLAESAVLALLGGGVGLAVALGLERLALGHLPQGIPRLSQAGLHMPVLVFSLGLTMLVALVSGLPAALRAIGGKGSIAVSLRAGSQRLDERMQLGMVVVEVALAVMLLVGAGLVLKSFDRLTSVDPGFDGDGVSALRIVPPAAKYEDDDRWRALNAELVERLGAIGGVEQVGGIHLLPLSLNNWNFPYQAEGLVLQADQETPRANYRVVAGDYFRTLGVPLIAGRLLAPSDRAGAENVVVVNQALADELWGATESIDRTLKLFMSQPHRIVGVVGNVRQHRLDLEIQPEMYYPADQKWAPGTMTYVVRASVPTPALFGDLRSAVRAVDPAIAIGDLMTMDEAVGRSVAEKRSMSLLLLAFGTLAVLLSLVGVYGVMTYLAGKRIREVGIRMALGARRSRVLGDGIRWAGGWVGLGLLIGGLGSLAIGRMVGGFLFQVSAYDPSVLISVLSGVAISAGLATLIPLERSSKCDPATVLRAE